MKFDVYFVHEYYIHNSNANNNSHITIIKRDTWKKRKRTNLSRQKYEQLCRFLSETKEKENEKQRGKYLQKRYQSLISMIFLMIIKMITTIENIISKILSSFIKKVINLSNCEKKN